MEYDSMYVGATYVRWSEADEWLMRLSPVRDVRPLCLDTKEGIVYGKEILQPHGVDLDEWLLEQAERDGVVVTEGMVIPIIGTFTPHPVSHRYLAKTYRSQVETNMQMLRLAQSPPKKAVAASVTASGLEQRNISLLVPFDTDRFEIAQQIVVRYILESRAILDTMSKRIDLVEDDLKRAMQQNGAS